jgi:Domain of unknown function (DUF4259)
MNASSEEHVGADACCIALGATEVVAACLGRAGVIPDRLVVWAEANQNKRDEQIRMLAEACTRKLDNQSELQELLDEGGRNEQWHTNLEELVQRLLG